MTTLYSVNKLDAAELGRSYVLARKESTTSRKRGKLRDGRARASLIRDPGGGDVAEL
jgi:hypothetical protein